MDEFYFLGTDGLQDEALTLRLRAALPAVPLKGYCPSYEFGICRNADGLEVGRLALRIGDEKQLYYAGHIGYTVFVPYRGQHYAARACKLAFGQARRHSMDSLLITANPDNMASRRTCELVGGQLLGIVDLPPEDEMYLEGDRQKCIYRVYL